MAPAPAAAGAWIAPTGGQTIVTTAVSENEEGYPLSEGSIYYERPVQHDTSIVFAPWIEVDPNVVSADSDDYWRSEVSLGLKHAVYRSDDNVVALQASAIWVSDPDQTCSEGGAEFRVLAGHSMAEGRAFMNVEAAARALSGGCEGARLDLTAGYRPSPNWLAMGQVFLDSPVEGDDTLKAQLSLVRFTRSGRGWQIGLRTRIDGDDLEPALVIGLWGRPRD